MQRFASQKIGWYQKDLSISPKSHNFLFPISQISIKESNSPQSTLNRHVTVGKDKLLAH